MDAYTYTHNFLKVVSFRQQTPNCTNNNLDARFRFACCFKDISLPCDIAMIKMYFLILAVLIAKPVYNAGYLAVKIFSSYISKDPYGEKKNKYTKA